MFRVTRMFRVACKNVDGWALVVVSGFEVCGYAEVYKHACAARTGLRDRVFLPTQE